MNDDSSQIFIYIIAVIGAVVLSVVKSYRKAKEQQAEIPLPERDDRWQGLEEEVPSPLEEMMRQFTRPVESAQTLPRAEVRPDIDLVRYQEIAQQRQQEQERDRKIERDRRFAALFRDNESRQTPEGEKKGKKEFDLKEAIIYSEIVNRKYE